MHTICIIGGGFSGAILTANLARANHSTPVRVVLVERRSTIGRGVAYSTPYRPHLLNVPAGRMSAWPHDPEHFLRWLQSSDPAITGGTFVRRSLFGEYVEFTLNEAIDAAAAEFHFERRQDTARQISIDSEHRGIVEFEHSAPVIADQVVLALGNPPPGVPLTREQCDALGRRFILDPWSADAVESCDPDESILLLGTGLTMVDFALTLKARGHRAPLFALSRHGLLPQSHRNPPRPPVSFDAPFRLDGWDGRVLSLLRWIRRAVRQAGEWREVINSLRSDTPAIWARLADVERGRFLRHLRPYWDVHRHRMAMEVYLTLQSMIDGGGLAILSGRLMDVAADQESVVAQVRPRGSSRIRTIRATKVVNCTGPESDWSRVDSPLVQGLLRDGLMVCDPFRLGIVTDRQGRLIDRFGNASRFLSTLGNPRRSELWETTAVPELRNQAAAMADHLLCCLGRGNLQLS